MNAEPKRKKKPLRILLDSNALLVPFQFKIDIFEELKTLLKMNFEAILLSPVRAELEEIAKTASPQMRKDFALALELAGKCKPVEICSEKTESTDDVIVKIASRWRASVFTNDKHLKKRLRDINVPVIYVRQKSKLEIDGRI
ncbi:MAG: DNA-binding protein [Candidatus Bathyarchaeota archaeon]|nr:DNA-binding protein [Candidatus Bathyarchaeota archaeon]